MTAGTQCVYFIQAGPGGLIKIGCSHWVKGRLDCLAGWSPVPLQILAEVPGEFQDEKRLHYRFREQWSHHEWFQPSSELLAVVEHVKLTGQLPQDDTPWDIIRAWRPREHREGAKRQAAKLAALWADPEWGAHQAACIRKAHQKNRDNRAAIRAERARMGYPS